MPKDFTGDVETTGLDSVYDSYLLCGEDPRKQLDYDLFLKRYPGWPKAWEHRYGPNGIFNEQSDCSDEVHYSKESESEEIVSERLKSSQVQRSPGKKANRGKKRRNSKELFSDSDDSDLRMSPSRKNKINI